METSYLFKREFLSTEGLVKGYIFDPQWVNDSTILVTNENDEDSRTLLLDIASKKEINTEMQQN